MWQQSEVERIERTFDIELPPDFRELVLDSSFTPRESELLKSVGDHTEWFDLDEFIEINTGILDGDRWDDPNVFAFASDWDGKYFCIELDTGDVLYWHHEDPDFCELGPFADWAAAPFEPKAPELPVVTQCLGCTGIALLLLAAFAIPVWFAVSCSGG
jgi:hypothetical protein